jgi:hypothetical protein
LRALRRIPPKLKKFHPRGGGGAILAVSPTETATKLTVRATSTVDRTKSGTATVTITEASQEAADQASAFKANPENARVLEITPENVTVNDKDAVEAALAAYAALSGEAKSLLANEKAKLDALSDKIAELEAAVTANKAPLNAAITSAHTASEDVYISYNEGHDITPGTKWVTQVVFDTFNAAIAAAQTVVGKATPTKKEVDDAVAALNNAISAFTNAIGTAQAIDAVTPVISGQPQGASYTVGGSALSLIITAMVTDGGNLAYQWYQAESNSAIGTAILGATFTSYTPSTATE